MLDLFKRGFVKNTNYRNVRISNHENYLEIMLLLGLDEIDGRMNRYGHEGIRIRRDELPAKFIGDFCALFRNIISSENEIGPHISPEFITFLLWLFRILEANPHCGSALALVQSWQADADLLIPAFSTSSFWRTGQRLSPYFLDVVKSFSED